uniref:Uncharacterized protein n=1 Tax=Arundo donax TaxID=35708 RepID=A0A0A9DJN3_ARUDO
MVIRREPLWSAASRGKCLVDVFTEQTREPSWSAASRGKGLVDAFTKQTLVQTTNGRSTPSAATLTNIKTRDSKL